MPEKKRIALFTRYLTMGGIQKVMVRLANGFAARGHPVDLVLAKGGGAVSRDVSPDVRIVNLDANRVWTALPGLLRYLDDASPAALISGEVPSNIVAMWAKMLSTGETRFFVSVHQYTSIHAKIGAMWYRRLLPYLIWMFYPRADGIITVSKGIAEDLRQVAPGAAGKTQVIYNPVVDRDIVEKADEPVSHPWLINKEVPVVLAVGRLTHEKNFSLLVRAFAKVCSHREARLIILGDGNQREVIERTIRNEGVGDRVDLHGFVSNPYPFMANASLLALSSIFEGLPTVLIEALACGCPVVSTDCPSGPREILEGGAWGRLVPVDDEGALAEAMLQSLAEHHDAEQLQRRAWDFSVDASVDGYLDALFANDESVNASKCDGRGRGVG